MICRVRTRLCALPLAHVAEILRPLPIEPISGGPEFVLWVAILRGVPVPVVDAARLIGAQAGRAARFVALQTGARMLALAVDDVAGIRRIAAESITDLPPLLSDLGSELVSRIATLDNDFLMVVESTRIVPEAVWATLQVRG